MTYILKSKPINYLHDPRQSNQTKTQPLIADRKNDKQVFHRKGQKGFSLTEDKNAYSTLRAVPVEAVQCSNKIKLGAIPERSFVLLSSPLFPKLIPYKYTAWILAKITSCLCCAGWGVRYENILEGYRDGAPQKEFGIFPYTFNIHSIKVTATAFPIKFG